MKNYLIPLCFVFLFACNINNQENNPPEKIKLLNTTKGGCNDQRFDLKSIELNENDNKVDFKVINDNLHVNVGVNYICCAIFDTYFETSNDSLLFYITDICTAEDNCYCKCMCYYTFDFVFDDFEYTTYPYKATLIGKDGNEVIGEGSVEIR